MSSNRNCTGGKSPTRNQSSLSAPALALVPVVAQGKLVTALVYLLTFSVGVMLAMLVFGLGLGGAQHWLSRRWNLLQHFRHGVAAASVVVGGYWLTQAL